VWLGYIDLRACIMDLELADCTCAWLAPLSSRFTERPYDSIGFGIVSALKAGRRRTLRQLDGWFLMGRLRRGRQLVLARAPAIQALAWPRRRRRERVGVAVARIALQELGQSGDGALHLDLRRADLCELLPHRRSVRARARSQEALSTARA
jgi:hypothetical protein